MNRNRRVHLIEPATLRKKRTEELLDRTISSRGGHNSARVIAGHKSSNRLPCRKTAAQYLQLEASELQNELTMADMMDAFFNEDKNDERFYCISLHNKISNRFAAAQRIRDNPALFEIWRSGPRICGLDRQPKDPDDTLRAFFRASFLDPRRASKYFKRVEHLWKAKKPSSEVRQLLKKYGLEKPIPGVSKPKSSDGKKADVEEPKPDIASYDLPATVEREGLKKSRADRTPYTATGVISNFPENWKPKVGNSVTIIAKITACNDTSLNFDVVHFEQRK